MRLESILSLSLCVLTVAWQSTLCAEELSLANAPPVVVRTVPEAGTTDVDPGLTEIKVTFSKDMRDGTWSWAQRSDNTFPETTGKPHYEPDKRTCVLPVKLQPGKTYLLLINSEKFRNFKDAERRPAAPYPLVFQTKAAP